MFNNVINSFKKTFDAWPESGPQTPTTSARPVHKDYLGSQDDLSRAGMRGSKINAESGRSYITQGYPSLNLLERLNLKAPPQDSPHKAFMLGKGHNSAGILLARNQQVLEENDPKAYVAMKILVDHEQAEREFATHQAMTHISFEGWTYHTWFRINAPTYLWSV